MKKITKSNQNGFSIVELVLIVAIIAVVGGVGYYVAHKNSAVVSTTASSKPASNSTMTPSSSVQSATPTSMPAAPQVTSSADLNTAVQALNQASIGSSTTDSSQLSTQASGF